VLAHCAAGWPIATGVIDGACHHLVTDRFDNTGAPIALGCAFCGMPRPTGDAMHGDAFLAGVAEPRRWSIDDDRASEDLLSPELLFLGQGEYALEVATARVDGWPRQDVLRDLWRRRWGRRANPLLLVAFYVHQGSTLAAVTGPVGEEPPVLRDVDPGQVERVCAAALAEPDRHAAVRVLASALDALDSDLPGVRNVGMFSTHQLRVGVPARDDWDAACRRGRQLLSRRGRALVEALGFEVEEHSTTASVLRVSGTKRAVAVFLADHEGFEQASERYTGTSPVTHALALAQREGLPWVVLTRGSRIRVHAARDLGVGRQGQPETFVELNLALLPDETAGYLLLLASADALAEAGTFDQILEDSHDYAAALGARLRERVYREAVPALGAALAPDESGELTDDDLAELYQQAMVALFRLLFVAYAEDKDLLPYRTNGRYQRHALKTTARDLAEQRRADQPDFDLQATHLWSDVTALWAAVRDGNRDWAVPAYDGGLFSNDPDVNPAGAALTHIELTNAELGPALAALLVDEAADGVIGPVDFRSLSVREFGTIYEGLLESRLAVAREDLTVAADGTFVPARAHDEIAVSQGGVYFHNRSGARKATGTYFTKPFAVEHLLDHALEPALNDHLARLEQLAAADDQAGVAEALFDFRCVDLAMGSGHFLVAAIDRIEARLSAFLALYPNGPVNAELETLKQQALGELGDLAASTEIEHASLLRRLVARRCIYGVDHNRIAVQLARLGVWIHTFVPGLPLSFLDHHLVCGDSLTGIGTIDEAVTALDPHHDSQQPSVFTDQIEGFLARAQGHLERLGQLADTTTADIAAARHTHAEARAAVEPAEQLFDLLIAARTGVADLPLEVTEDKIAAHPHLEAAQQHAAGLQALHFPIAFPEVFLRDRPGFDCVLGNPPWEEATVERPGFWTLRFPGLKSLTPGRQRREIDKLERDHPHLKAEYDQSLADNAELRALLLAGPYPGMGTGDPELYKAFCWRFWHLVRDDGAIGVVLPRSALSAKGSTAWREAVLDGGTFDDVTMLLNSKNWIFPTHPQYTIGLVSIRKGHAHTGTLRLRGPYPSLARYREGVTAKPAEIASEDLRSWTDTVSFPLLPSPEGLEVFVKLRAYPRLDTESDDWYVRPAAELHATNERQPMIFSDEPPKGAWPVYKGASFDLWEPDTGVYYAWADPKTLVDYLQQKRHRQQRRSNSVFRAFSTEWGADSETLPCRHPRVAFRDASRATDSRTVRTALVPGKVALTNKAPYFVWPRGEATDEAYLLGVLTSIPLDWYARRFVEDSVNFYILNAFPVPRPDRNDPIRGVVVETAGRLAAVDERFSDWAAAVGVPVGSVEADEHPELLARLDAAVALLYQLSEGDLRVIFETFHEGWNYHDRLARTLRHLRDLEAGHEELAQGT
jgi:hypothetical protein